MGNNASLYEACKRGDCGIVRSLLDGGEHAQLHVRGLWHDTCLHAATWNHQVEVVRLLLEHGGIDVEAQDHRKKTAAELTLERHFLDAFMLFAKHGAHVNLSEALYVACSSKQYQYVPELLAMGAPTTFPCWGTHSTPLHAVAKANNREATKQLLDAGADTAARDTNNRTPLDIAINSTSWDALTELALRMSDPDRGAAVYYTARHGKTALVSELLSAHAPITHLGPWKDIPLHAAVWNGHAAIVDMLLAAGADTQARCQRGCSPADLAIERNRIELLLPLAQHGSAQDKARALHTAAARGNVRLVSGLLALGAGTDFRGPNSDTPLHAAVAGRHGEVVKMLVQSGADVLASDCRDRTPASLAVELREVALIQHLCGSYATSGSTCDEAAYFSVDGSSNMPASCRAPCMDAHALGQVLYDAAIRGNAANVQILLDIGAPIGFLSPRHDTALHAAARHGHAEVVQVLLDRHAEYDVRDEQGSTAGDIAIQRRDLDILAMLYRHILKNKPEVKIDVQGACGMVVTHAVNAGASVSGCSGALPVMNGGSGSDKVQVLVQIISPSAMAD